MSAIPSPSRRGALAVLRLPAILALLATGGCSITGVLAATTPGRATIDRDIPYGDGPRRTLDVYTPDPHGSAPVVVFIYGGSWQDGDKAMYRFVGKSLASKGFVTVIPDYRVYPEVKYPEFLRDNAQAVRWAHDHAADFGGDATRLFLVGHSAGAYNVAMLNLDRRWLNAVGMDPARDVRAAVALSGPYDFLPLQDDTLKVIFGPEQTRPLTQPITYVDGAAPPMLLGAGTADKVVDPANATRLSARIHAKGGEAEVRFYPRVSHALAIGAFAAPLRFTAPTLKDTVAFMRRHDRSPGAPPAPR
jgi:acetyl esterase/lipase